MAAGPDRQLPWTNSCFVCGESNPHGLRLRPRFEAGRVVLEHTVRTEDSGWKDVMHGGITMALLDEAMTWAAILAAEQGCVAAEFTARLKQPIRTGDRIRVEGWAVERRRRVVKADGRVLSAGGDLLASAEGTYMALPAERSAGFMKDFIQPQQEAGA